MDRPLTPASAPASPTRPLEPELYTALPGWEADDQRPAFAAFRRSAFRVLDKPYRTGAYGIGCGDLEDAFAAARAHADPDPGEARAFFERFFLPCLVSDVTGGEGFLTGFYEPEAEASPVRTREFTVPLMRRPDDLVDIDEAAPPAGIEAGYAFARPTLDSLVAYHDRSEIEGGALAGRGLEIAWLENPVDAFFIHVQGAARLAMTDGTTRRVTYAAKSGHPFTGPGRVLAELGEIPPGQVTMQSIRAWLRDNPHRVSEILWRNRSYIFFRESEPGTPELGPVAAAKVQLEPGRSLAVDRRIYTFATPFFVDAPSLDAVDERPFRRLMIAQDTGSAIVGPARGDIFVGTGHAAGEIAGVVKHPGRFHMLVPRQLVSGAR